MAYAKHLAYQAMQGTPPTYNGGIPVKKRKKKTAPHSFCGELNDDDPNICLNCMLPANLCKGEHACYMERKKEKENGNKRKNIERD